MKRKIAAILAADIAGYSRLVAEDEEETLRRLSAYRAVFEDFIANRGGRIFNTAGDSVLAEFPSSVDAVRCAVEIQESLRTRNMAFPASRQMLFRIGVTIADVVERDGDLLGDGVNIAARLENLAAPGGICVSRAVHEQVANKLSVQFTDIGQQVVKNIPEPVHAYIIALDGDAHPSRVHPVLHATAGRSSPRRLAATPSVVFSAIAALAASAALAVTLLRQQPAPPSPPAPVATTTPATVPSAASPAVTSPPVGPAAVDTKPASAPKADVAPATNGGKAAASPSSTSPPSPASLPSTPAPPAPSPPARPSGEAVTTALPAPAPTAPASGKALDASPAGAQSTAAAAAPATTFAAVQPFDVRAVPLVPPGQQAALRALMSSGTGRKALAVSGNGRFAVGVDPSSAEEAARQAGEACRQAAAAPCRIIAVDDAFVVPIPRSGWIRGFFDAASSDLIAAAERAEVVRQLAGKGGWSAVAVGASGKPGTAQSAPSEAEAVKAALTRCAAVDRNCRIVAIGPFRVEPF